MSAGKRPGSSSTETPRVSVPEQARGTRLRAGSDTGTATAPDTAPDTEHGQTADAVAATGSALSTDGVPAQQAAATPDKRRRRRLRTWLSPLLSVAIIVGVFWFFLPQFTSISAVGRSIRSMTAVASGGLVLAALWNLTTYWMVMVATMPGLRYREAAVVTEAATAVSNTLPGGSAIGVAMSYEMYYSWGFSRSRASVSLVVSGIFNNLAKLAMPVIALALLALSGSPSSGRVIAGLVGVGALVAAVTVLGLMLHSAAFCARVGIVSQGIATAIVRPFGKPPATGWDKATLKFRDRTVLLLRARWPWITVTTVLSHVSLFVVLLVALRAVGVSEPDVGWVQALAVFSFARLVTAVPLTPGGLGVVELALIGGLASAGGPRAEVAAAVLIFRALTYVLPIPLGLVTYLFWRRNTSWRRAPGTAPRTALVPETPSSSRSAAENSASASESESASESPPASTDASRRVDVGTAPAEHLVIERESSPGSGSLAPEPILWLRPQVYAFGALGALGLLLLTTLPISATSVPDPERSVFRVVNDRTFVPFLLVWPFMQLGNFVVVPVAGLIAAAFRKFRLSATILVGGGLVWMLAKVVKHQFERGRPPALLPDVHLHGAVSLGLGYPSGHAAVAALIATVCWPYLDRRGRVAAAVLVAVVCLARMWVGAHLPLDVVAGAAVGVAIGSVLVLVAGRPGRRSAAG